MALKEFLQGTIIFQSGQLLNCIGIITRGSVKAMFGETELLLEKGDAIGLADINFLVHSCTYTAIDNTSVFLYPYSRPEDLSTLLKNGGELSTLIAAAMTRQLCAILDSYILKQYDCDNLYQYLLNMYDEYTALCVRYSIPAKDFPGIASLEKLVLEDDVDQWVCDYYEGIKDLPEETRKLLFHDNSSICAGYLLRASNDYHSILEIIQIIDDYLSEVSMLLLNTSHIDLFDFYSGLYFRACREHGNTIPLAASISKLLIQIESLSSIEKTLCKSRISEYKSKLQLISDERNDSLENEDSTISSSDKATLTDSLTTILHYSGCSNDLASSLKAGIMEYRSIIDKTSKDDTIRILRKQLAKQFYELYAAVFEVSLTDHKIPVIIKMFLNFGYLDEELAGMENAAYLYCIADELCGDLVLGFYTLYEWLLAIYYGKKNPSRNEFEIDYVSHVHELKVSKKIDEESEQSMLADAMQRVMYEVHNMFPLVNRMTFGRITTFCPIFSEHNVLKDLSSCLVTASAIKNSLQLIRSVDYTAFYRETIYTNPENNISKEYIHVEVTPDIILMPNIGSRGVMWQEIEGRRRTTPARIMLPVFMTEDISSSLIRLTGEFRWEMCRRIQGARWNDVTDRSLTSEYFDYVQFYNKNNDLSPDAKEKLKLSLTKAKNSFKEMFVRDYILWVMYEGNGSPRLNRVARQILFTYCPFSKIIQEKLCTNPLYKDIIDKYNVKKAQKLHHLDNVFTKLKNTGTPIPSELMKQRQFLEG